MSSSDHPHRTRARDPGGARVTPRDLVLLRFTAEAQPVRAADLAVLSGMSLQMVRRRCRVLRDLGIFATHVVASEDCNYYTLGRRAPPVLERLAVPSERIHVPSGIGKVNLTHHLGSVRLHAALLAGAARAHVDVVEFMHEREVRRMTGAQPGVKVPDAVAVVRPSANDELIAVALEIDTGSEKNPSAVAASKMRPYTATYLRGDALRGTKRWFVAFVCSTTRRLHRLVRAAWEEGVPEGFVYFAVLENIDDRTVLGDAWVTPRLVGETARLVRESPWLVTRAVPKPVTTAGMGDTRNDRP